MGKTQQRAALDAFLRRVEKKAYCLALRSLRHREEALDAVQEAMLKLVDRYSEKPEADLEPLFFRILFNQITDIQRRATRTGSIFARWFTSGGDEGSDSDSASDQAYIQHAEDPQCRAADEELDVERMKARVDVAMAKLPEKQRQAFMLRVWLGFDVKQTAVVMNCGEGSVKTHFSRARQALQKYVTD